MLTNNVIANLRVNNQQFNRGMRTSQRMAEDFKRSVRGAGAVTMNKAAHSWESMGRSVSNAGRNVATVTGIMATAATAGIASAVRTASSFEDAFADLKKVTEATDAEFKVMDKSIRKLTKRIPATYEEIAQAAAAASRLGVEKEHLISFAEVAIMMGTATDMSMEFAADSLARFSNIMQTSLGDADKLGSSIVDLGNNFATSESEIMAMAMRLAAAGKQAGMSEGDVLGLAAAMSSLGIRAEMGGTAMSTIMSKIGRELALGGENAKKWADVAGMSVKDFQKAFEEDALGAIIALLGGMDDAVKSGKNLDMMLRDLGINEARQLDVLKRLIPGMELLSDAQERGNRAFEEGVALTNEAEQRYDTFSSKLQIFRNRIRDISSIIGDMFKDALVDVMDALSPLLDRIGEWLEKINESDGSMRKIIPIVGLFGTGLLALATVLAMIVTGIGFTITALGAIKTAIGPVIAKSAILRGGVSLLGRAFALLLGPIGWVITILSLLIPFFVKLYKENESFRNAVDKAWLQIKAIIATVVRWVINFVVSAWNRLVQFWEEHGDNIVDFAKNTWETVKETVLSVVGAVVDYVSEKIDQLKSFWEENGDQIRQAWENVWGVIKAVYNTVIAPIFGFIINNLYLLKYVWNAVWIVVKYIVISTWEAIKNVINGALNIILGIVKFFSALFTGDFGGMWEGIKQIFSGALEFIWGLIQLVFIGRILKIGKALFMGLRNIVTAGWNYIVNVFRNSVGGIWGTIKTVFSTIYQFFRTIFLAIRSVFTGAWNRIRNQTGTTMENIRGAISIAWNAIRTIFTAVLRFIVSWVRTQFSNVVNAVWTRMTNVWATIVNIWNLVIGFMRGINLREIGRNIIQGLINGIIAMGENLFKAVTGVVSNAVDGVLSFLGIKSPSRLMMDVGEDTMAGFEIGVDNGADSVLDSFESVAFGLEDTGWDMVDTSSYIGDTVGSNFSDLSFDVVDSFDSMASGMDQAGLLMSDTSSYISSSVSSDFMDLSGNVSSSVSTGFGEAEKVSMSRMQSMSRATGDSFRGMEKQVSSAMKGISNAISKGFSVSSKSIVKTMNSIMTSVTKGFHTAATVVNKSMKSINDAVRKGFTGSVKSVTSAITTMTNAIVRGFSTATRTVSSSMVSINRVVSNGFRSSSNAVRSGINSMVSVTNSGFNRLRSSAANGMNRTVSSVTSGVSRMVSAVRGRVGQFTSAGRDLINGLIRGINSRAGVAIATVARTANQMANAARKQLRIHSPSRVFRDIGLFVVKGLAAGVDKESKTAVKSTTRLSNLIQKSFNPNLDPAKVNMGYQLRKVGREAQSQMTNTVQGELSVSRQPAYITLQLGRRDFKFFVEDITEVQDRGKGIRDKFR
ncbi:phage tail tape measure protein [Halalkalibacterium halodurans]|uniref:phage tail tape measure protein n=1 Tax=Halalkalibacterium halodurans TaxID=86665 RepID=UPI002E20CA98|nr:phage tail tape measure protein [Halalkalibacterium halodurans]MED4172558.1 phage tail tape measure protein [Halalkalibacterium halodurans]